MSYLKIYPKRIFATLNVEGTFEGFFSFHLEQYGLQEIDKKCDVKIVQESFEWQIWVQPVSGLETPQFRQFVESLNNYLFLVLKVTPGHESKKPELPSVDVFFDDVYFDMSGPEPVIQKLPK